MDGMKENQLKLNIPTTNEDIAFTREMNKTMEIFKDITDVFIKHHISYDESLMYLEAISSAVQIYMLKGIKFEDVFSNEGE